MPFELLVLVVPLRACKDVDRLAVCRLLAISCTCVDLSYLNRAHHLYAQGLEPLNSFIRPLMTHGFEPLKSCSPPLMTHGFEPLKLCSSPHRDDNAPSSILTLAQHCVILNTSVHKAINILSHQPTK
ncbi:hypothetical protein Btru_019916 [Bulinus truncatus]|nr:hypothetical protein Btru_019916 [Bulinus truncatus]